MRNKFLAALLTLCMTSAMFSSAVFAQENEIIANMAEEVVTEEEDALLEEESGTEEAEEIYFSDGQEIHRVSREAPQEPERADAGEAVNENPQEDGNVREEVSAEQNVGETELIQLKAPTDLKWGVKIERWISDTEHITSNVPGHIFWKADGRSDGTELKFYREGESKPVISVYYDTRTGRQWDVCSSGMFNLEDLDSGKYYFTAQSWGDGIEYSDSEIVKSDIWEYKKPEAQIEASIIGLEWEWPKIKWISPDNMSEIESFQIEIFFSKTENGEATSILGMTGYNGIEECSINDATILKYGKGYYYFKVSALSNDITKYQNGAWSALSPAYNLTEITESVSDSLNNILNSSSGDDPSEIRQQVASINRTDLRSSMLADPAVLNSIQQLEQKITDNDGVDVEVNVADSNVAENFPADKVQIVGAKLNNPKADATKITLQIDQPKKEDLVIPSRYKNTLAIKFSMDINGLEESADQTLTVPVRITLPVPANINPKRLSILHYSSDGSYVPYETPTNIYTYQGEDGQWYVSFILDHFSDFVMTETASAVVTFDANGGACGTQTLSVNEINTLPEIPVPTRSGYTFDGWYTQDGIKVDSTTVFTEDATVTAKWTPSTTNPTAAPISTPIASPSVTPGGNTTPTPSENETPAATPTPSENETPAVTPEPTQTPTPQPKTAQILKTKYNSENGQLKKQIGSTLTQKVTGAKTAVTFTSSNPKVAKVNKTSGAITCVGVGKAIITAKAEESSQYKAAQKSITIVVIPKTAGIKSLKSNKTGRVTLKSTSKANGNDGYQIQYKHNGKNKKVSVKSSKAITKIFKNLKSGKAFKARIRAYKKVGNKTYYGKYSPWKTLKKVR